MSTKPYHAGNPTFIIQGLAIFNLLESAQKKLKWPKLTYKSTDGRGKLVFYIAGEHSKYKGQIQMTDGGRFGDNKWYGRIEKHNLNQSSLVFLSPQVGPVAGLDKLIEEIVAKPAEMAKLQGQKYGHCIFCGLELTNKNSLTVGYGPICAENYGLPWEGMADEAAKKWETL
jgi:hypothetical protein